MEHCLFDNDEKSTEIASKIGSHRTSQYRPCLWSSISDWDPFIIAVDYSIDRVM